MFKKEYLYTLLSGLITAFFAVVILINTEISFIKIAWISIPIGALFIILPIGEYVGYLVASRLFASRAGLKQLAKFGIVGVMNFSVDTGILTTLSHKTGIFEGTGLIPLNIISSAIAIVNSYFWQRRWTFTEKAPPTRREFFTFVAVTVIGIILNSFIVFVLTTAINPFDGFTPARLEVAAKIAATMISLFWNFLGYKFIVFK
jgi:putative flippase GtrA